MAKRVTDEDADLLEELGVDTAPTAKGGRTPREQRIIAGFEEIERFYDEHKRLPQHGDERDIFERLYAVRLDRLRASGECRAVLQDMDPRGLLNTPTVTEPTDDEASDADLLAALGVTGTPGDDVTKLVHVRPHAERKAAEEIAEHKPCADFATFRPVFEQVQQELNAKQRTTVRFQHNGKIEPGDLFILDGQKALVASADKAFMTEFKREDRRLRVVYDNGTESNLLMRSLQRALYKDEHGRRIVPLDHEAIPLFADQLDDGDAEAGTIYVLRSQSDDSFIAEHRNLIHKIGVTGGDAKDRVANAKKDPTYLLADVDIVATYKLANVNRVKLEAILRHFFQEVRLDVQLQDRFGAHVKPQEWFMVPLTAIDEAIDRIKDGTISNFRYDPQAAMIVSV